MTKFKNGILYVETQSDLEDGAFINDNSIKKIIIEGDVISIPCDCFRDCNNLKEVIIKAKVRFIEYCAFMNCTNIKVISIPNTCISISDFAFENCEKLKIIIGEKNILSKLDVGVYNEQLFKAKTTKGYYNFEGKMEDGSIINECFTDFKEYKNFVKKNNQYIDVKLSTIGKPSIANSNKLFSNFKKVEHINIHDLNIQNCTDCSEMFANCYNLKEIKMPEKGFKKVKYFDKAFYNNSNLTKINFYTSDLSNLCIMEKCFEYCKKLKEIIPPKNTSFPNLRNVSRVFYGCANIETLDLSDLSFPKLKTIDKTFAACANLKSLKLPELKNAMFAYRTFNFCHKLENLSVPNKIKLETAEEYDCIMSECLLIDKKEEYFEI